VSNLSVNTITNAAGGNTAQINGFTPSISNMAGRNRIINGDMRIDQRNAGASVTPLAGQFLVDRYRASLSQTSKYSAQQNAGSVTPPTGFTNYLGFTSLSAYSILASDFFSFVQPVEGLNFSDLAWGTASAAPVTLSFWARSSLTGTFGGALQNFDLSRSYPFTFSVAASGTWEYKTITVPGDTAGTWLTTNGIGLQLRFSLGTGSDRTGPANAWASANYNSATGAVSVVGTSGATFYITGVQLEAGSVATPFERRPFGTELQLCERYFKWLPPLQGNFIVGGSSIFVAGMGNTLTNMRASPTFTLVNGAGAIHVSNFANINVNSLNDTNLSYCRVNTASSPGAYAGAHFNAGNIISLSAEL
jgi:hypothetical protein